MKISFDKLLSDYNQAHPLDKLSKVKLAREMVDAGIMLSEISALNMIRYNSKGQAKSIDFLMLEFLCTKFNVKPNEIIQ
jgi:DNA-binding Xre family transcriptional regulator